MNGLRTTKTVGGVTHSYVYASGKLLRDSWTESGVFCALDFFYDYAGNPYAVFYQKGSSRQRFYYLTNLQGDVIGLLNTSSQLVAEYDYDPYGNLLTKTNYVASGLASEICDRNPLRYRGYYFDTETGWYYLQSRYYDPALGRFLNADSYASTGQGFLGYNMFAYCGNNPIRFTDSGGTLYIEAHPIDTDPDVEGGNHEHGFMVDYSDDFLDPYYCLEFAYEIVEVYGNGYSYRNMDAQRIAMEIYAHAVFYCAGKNMMESASILSGIYINSDTSIPTIFGDRGLYYVGQWLVRKGKTIYVNNDEPLHRIIPYNAIWHGHTSKSETEKRFRAHHPTAPTYRAVISSANRTQTLSCN